METMPTNYWQTILNKEKEKKEKRKQSDLRLWNKSEDWKKRHERHKRD